MPLPLGVPATSETSVPSLVDVGKAVVLKRTIVPVKSTDEGVSQVIVTDLFPGVGITFVTTAGAAALTLLILIKPDKFPKAKTRTSEIGTSFKKVFLKRLFTIEILRANFNRKS